MTTPDARWLEALIEARLVTPVELTPAPACCCGKPFEQDGVIYNVVDAGCKIHAPKSRIGERRKAAVQQWIE
jgi:hypothetical protein